MMNGLNLGIVIGVFWLHGLILIKDYEYSSLRNSQSSSEWVSSVLGFLATLNFILIDDNCTYSSKVFVTNTMVILKSWNN